MWSAGLAWQKAVVELVRAAAYNWTFTHSQLALTVGPGKAFVKTQCALPAVLPTWWLAHFPLSVNPNPQTLHPKRLLLLLYYSQA